MSLTTLKADLRQELKLTPQLLQSIEVLQMNSQELLEYLGKAAEENPVLEQEDAPALREAYEDLRRKAGWIDGGVWGSTFFHEGREYQEKGKPDREAESLTGFLWDQLERRNLPKPLLALSKYLAEMVDEDGYLAEEDVESLSELQLPQDLVSEAVKTVQSLEPPGVGARSLPECLTIQLSRRGVDISPALLEIVARFLPELGRKHYGPICRALGLSVEELREAERTIAALNPYPGRAFQPAEPVAYVRPDVFIVEENGELSVVLNEYYLPRITISGYYTRLMKESDEPKTREYLREKLRQAKSLLDSLDRRNATLRRCAEAVLSAQMPFFTGKTGELNPMSLRSLAEELDFHASTISRTIHGKYLQCRQGTYPLRYFFSGPVGKLGISRQAVQQKLLTLIREEDPRHPLSDRRLSELLSSSGVPVARRTVAKYREQLRIGSSTVRRRDK